MKRKLFLFLLLPCLTITIAKGQNIALLDNEVDVQSVCTQSLCQSSDQFFSENSGQQFVVEPPYKNPGFAFICSFFPGAGQFYNDELGKGLAFMVGTSASAGISYLSHIIYKEYYSDASNFSEERHGRTSFGAIFFGVIAVGLYVWQSVDAVVTANNMNIKNGYVLSFTPSVMDNHFAYATGGSEYVPAMSFNLSF